MNSETKNIWKHNFYHKRKDSLNKSGDLNMLPESYI